MNIKHWSEKLTKDVYEKYKGAYSFWEPGFKIFYSPVFIHPKLAIIGFQPGGNETDYAREHKNDFESGNFSLPAANEFLDAEYKFAKKIRSLFSFVGGFDLLKQAIVFPLIFFRAPSASVWRTISKDKRLEMEDLCLLKIHEILQKTKPQKILFLGLETYNIFKKKFGPAYSEKILHKRFVNKSKMVISSMIGGCSVLAIIHPTGSRISNIDWDSIKSLFQEWVNDGSL